MLKHSVPQLLLVPGSDIDRTTLHHKLEAVFIYLARAILSEVGVLLLGTDASCHLHILKSMRRKAAIAPMIIEVTGAIYQLLLRKAIKGTILDERVCLKAAYCGEGPA